MGGVEKAWNETPVTTTTATQEGSRWDDYKTTYFPPQAAQGRNRLLKWLCDNEKFLKTNIYAREKHIDVLKRYPGSRNLYRGRIQTLEDNAKANNDKVSNIDAYIAMVHSICIMKQKKSDEWNEGINPIMMSMEGNNRMGAFFHMLFEAKYDTREGKLVRGSIDKTSFIRTLGEPAERNRNDIEEAMADVDLKELIRSTLDDNESVFNRALIHMVVVYGITEEEYMKEKIPSMQTVYEGDIAYSKRISDDKTRSAVPPETRQLATNLKKIIDLIESNEQEPDEETVNFSANASNCARLYVEFNTQLSGNKDNKTPDECSLFKKKSWKQLVDNPNENTIKNHFQSIDMGSVIKAAGQRGATVKTLTPSGNERYHPPRALCENSVFRDLGIIKKTVKPNDQTIPNKKRKQKAKEGSEKAAKNQKEQRKFTNAQVRIEKGLLHMPLGVEEHLKAVILAVILPALFRIYHNIVASAWDASPLKNDCNLALKYLIATHVPMDRANQFGTALEDKNGAWAKKDWARLFGLTAENTPMSIHKSYLASALCIADIMISLLCLEKKEGVSRAYEFVRLLATVHDDPDYDAMSFVEALGKYNQIEVKSDYIIELT